MSGPPRYCEHNPNKAFASCSVPQELTNEEIDAADSEAGESDEDEQEGLKRRRIPAVWQLLKDNVLAHRKRKCQDEDDIMICHCKPVYRGGDGCGPDCINRMLCIECVPGFCPSEEKCTNQMFSKRMYANLEIRRAGAKGFGLFALEDIKAGQFIIEYIGHAWRAQGNISRFINHSCEPNCETQKWLVRGELAIGLFAARDIPKDCELTFDYNFERYGDKPMRCYCNSNGCRSFIGGQQDNFDVSLLPAVEFVEDASVDLPPVMLGDTDMDPNMRMLLEWRIGTKVDKTKEMGMLTRLERLCKGRSVNWSVKQFFGQEPVPAPQQHNGQKPLLPPGTAAAAPVALSTSGRPAAADKAAADAAPSAAPAAAPAPAKAKQQRKADKVAAAAGAAAAAAGAGGAAAGGTAAKGSKAAAAGAAAAAKQGSEGATHAAGVAKLRIEDSAAGSGGAAAGPGPAGGATPAAGAARQAPATTPSTVPELAQARGPIKALFKQWKIMQQQDSTPAPAAPEEKPAATPSSPPSPRSPHSPPSPQPPHSPRPEPSLEDDDPSLAAAAIARATATDAAKHVPLRKRLRRLPPKPPPAPPAPAEPAAAAAAANGAAQPPKGADSGGPTAPSAAPTGPAARKNSVGSAGAVAPYSPRRSASPPPLGGSARAGGGGFGGSGAAAGGGGSAAASARKLRSEIDRRLDEVVGHSGRLKEANRQNVIKVLRLFNLCDIGGGHPNRNNGFGAAAGGRYLNGGGGGGLPLRNGGGGDDGGMGGAGPGPGSAAAGPTARQRARMADLSLLLDVVLKTTSSAAKKEFVTCGLLTQLHQAMGRNTGKEYCVILRKVYREVVAKERRAWDERRGAGVYKPIERHKLEANLKEFVRSTIKRMRDREKEKAAAAGAGSAAGGGGHGTTPRPPQQHHQRGVAVYSLTSPPQPGGGAAAGTGAAGDAAEAPDVPHAAEHAPTRLRAPSPTSPSPAPEGAPPPRQEAGAAVASAAVAGELGAMSAAPGPLSKAAAMPEASPVSEEAAARSPRGEAAVPGGSPRGGAVEPEASPVSEAGAAGSSPRGEVAEPEASPVSEATAPPSPRGEEAPASRGPSERGVAAAASPASAGEAASPGLLDEAAALSCAAERGGAALAGGCAEDHPMGDGEGRAAAAGGGDSGAGGDTVMAEAVAA
ncbi:Histone-lysine N-methyltransferase ASHH2 [Tetrabaena socialis]|uniref:Histone-lysine N-methyltransferase ASHH2 n=1 Tax=Tetrabaena socialis TaxID=47790 RepID=A0A2J8A7W5_9CHLO|nr:Histone-lysine N-methyltransferase ASHH2 [Tetrabaena socialis]|eukprot:PNH08632.1 Histone-lysine N-methyltransferase ASHH2 [Tetrabaena socialis]